MKNGKHLLKRAKGILSIEARAILELRKHLDPHLQKAVERIVDCEGRVAVMGIGKSGFVGRKIASTLASTGTPAFFLHPTEGIHGDLGMLSEGDLVVALSYSGETEELKRILPLIKQMKLGIIAITGRAHSKLAQAANVVVPIPPIQEACPYNLTPTASSTAMLALGDALAICVMEQKGFGKEDFARLHPGGTLGKKLHLRVEDMMHQGEDNPIVYIDDNVQKALSVMTRTRLGATSIINRRGKLVGFFTDGDLRRHLQKDNHILEKKMHQVMTKNPKVIQANTLASQAAKIIKTHNFDNLPVVDSRHRPVGIVDERDLIAEGLV